MLNEKSNRPAVILFSLLFPLISSPAAYSQSAAYAELLSDPGSARAAVPLTPPAVPGGGAEKSSASRESQKIMKLTDEALAAASPGQKIQMLKTLINDSHPDQNNSDGNNWDQPDLEKAILRVLGSAPDAAAFDYVYYRLDHGQLSRSVGWYKDISNLADKYRATVVPGDWQGMRRYVDAVTETSSAGRNYIKFLIDGREVMPAAGPVLQAAAKSIHIEIFHLQADKIGWGLANVLSAKARAGVAVRFLIDERGSKAEHEPELQKLIASLRASGAAVIVKEPSAHFEGHLDHRKVIVIDGKTAFTGGMNIGLDYQEKWHDQQTLVIGPAVARLQEAFLERWKNAGGSYSPAEDLFPALAEAADGAETQVVGHIGRNDQNIKAVYLRAIGTAQKTVRIATPYFTDKDVINALRAAARRGVKVQLVFPKENNIPLVQSAARANYPKLIKAGVEIYEYKGRMAHLKVTAIDSVWATFGSSNLDTRSMKNNDELNLVINDAAVATDIETRLFGADIPQSERITHYSPSLMDHISDQFGGLL
ncbi:MAG: phosphatidylserine/phosphatidylglycerophosphate/cardiolipin synthase family protein [Elusimicrobia bacterium]|nr:phosphatidylserine/phosphatidylglycerophosphate/cardiolipin synthase family protein [Elusimicrobiota bacterium]